MEQYILKSALVAEINRYKHKADERLKITGRTLAEDLKDRALQNLCGNLLHFIDTIEVKEVDLEKEIKKYIEDNICGYCVPGVEETAKHFFELGLKAKKEVEEEPYVMGKIGKFTTTTK